jgi:hypothetical protein
MGLFIFCNISSIKYSSSQIFLDESIKYKTKSESLRDHMATLFICSLNFFFDLCIPGVSKNIICESLSLKTPRTFFLVV